MPVAWGGGPVADLPEGITGSVTSLWGRLDDLELALYRSGVESVGHPRIHGVDSHSPRDNMTASTGPTVNDDVSLGYGVGSRWFDTTGVAFYVCVDASDGAADWAGIGSSGGLTDHDHTGDPGDGGVISHNTLDDAYDEGGAGAGRTIEVDSNPVLLQSGSSGGTPAASTLLALEDSASGYLQFLSGTSSEGGIYFGDSGSATIGGIVYDHATNTLALTAGAVQGVIQRTDSLDLTSALYLDNTKGMVIVETADHPETPAATKGQIWVKSDVPNTLWFTDDGGTDHQLGLIGGSGGLDDAYNNGTDITVDAGDVLLTNTSTGLSPVSGTLLTIENTPDAYLQFLVPAGGEAGMVFGEAGVGNAAGSVTYEGAANRIDMDVGGVNLFRLSSSLAVFENVASAGNAISLRVISEDTSTFSGIGFGDQADTFVAGMDYDHNADLLTLWSEDTAVALIDTDSFRMQIPFTMYYNATEATLTVAGEMAVDSNGDGATVIDPVLLIYNGTAMRYGFFATGYPSSDNDVMAYDSASNTVTWQAQAGGGGSPGGADTNVQYNNAGAFGGDANFVYDGSGTATLNTALRTPLIEYTDGTDLLTLTASTITAEQDLIVASGANMAIQSAINATRMLNISPTSSLTTNWDGINISPTLTPTASSLQIRGLQAGMGVQPSTGTTTTLVYGLDFTLTPLAGSSVTATITTAIGQFVRVKPSIILATNTRSLTFTDLVGIGVITEATCTSSGASGDADITATNVYGLWVQDPNWTPSIISGDADITMTTWYGIKVDGTTDSNANVHGTTAYGVYIGDVSGTSWSGNTTGLYITNTGTYAVHVDDGLARFDGDTTHVFELPADATDPTGGGGAATGRIPVTIGGVTRYLAYY